MHSSEFNGVGNKPIRLAMLGMVEGNGHPYSWSAIFNGYEPEAMAQCPYAAIPEYLGKEPEKAFGLDGARVTHVWTDNPQDAPRVAGAARIPHVAAAPEDVIGHVDAVIVATDIGAEHVERCRPFVEAGLPVFVDKPLVDNAADLAVFRRWIAEENRPILSSSCMAYAKEFAPWRASTHDLGALRYVTVTTAKSWERYGIHALSAAYPVLGPGFISARNTGDAGSNVVHFRHQTGAELVVVANRDMYGAFGCLLLCGTAGHRFVSFSDTFYAFKAQLQAFVQFLRTGQRPVPFAQTEELMRMVIAGILSRAAGGAATELKEIA